MPAESLQGKKETKTRLGYPRFVDEIDFGQIQPIHPAGICLLNVNNKNSRRRCEVCSKLTRKTPERRHLRRSGVVIVNSEHISLLVLVFLLLTLNM